MSALEEKKWFIYVTDHHEGPWSLQEVSEKLASGIINEKNFVWTDGMGDWAPFSTMPELAALLIQEPSPAVPISKAESAIQAMPAFEAPPAEEQSFFKDIEKTDAGLGIEVALSSEQLRTNLHAESSTLNQSFADETPNATPVETLDLPDSAAISLNPFLDEVPEVSGISSEMSEQKAEIKSEMILEGQLEDAPAYEAPKTETRSEPIQDESGIEMPTLEEPVLEGQLGKKQDSSMQSEKTLIGERPDQPTDSVAAPKKAKKAGSKFKMVALAFVLLLSGGLFLFSKQYLSPLTSAVQGTLSPYLGRWISAIPKLEDVETEEYEQLKEAAVSSGTPSGIRVALGLSKENLITPKFYVASDLPDGTTYEIQIEANNDTLLNQFAFTAKTKVVLKNRLGTSDPIKTNTGIVIPRADYVVSVFEADTKKLAARKNYFLGGPRDAAYLERLNDFHERLKRKAQDEVIELSQFSETLESQLGQLNSQFAALKSFHGSKSKLKPWNTFNESFKKMQTQFEGSVQKWTPENLQNDLFYGMIYAIVPETLQNLGRLQKSQDQYLQASEPAATLEVEIADLATKAAASVDNLKKKISDAKALPTSSKGLPRREGL